MKNMITNNTVELVHISEVPKILALSIRQVYRLISQGLLPAPAKQGRKSYFFRKDIDNYLEVLRRARA